MLRSTARTDDTERVVVRDKRRLDPESGELRASVVEGPRRGRPGEEQLGDELVADIDRVAAELTATCSGSRPSTPTTASGSP